MLNLSFLSKHISLEGWSFSRQTQSCEARHEQDFFKSNTFASGLRSEYSNHSWSILAGSSCNLAATVYQKFDPLECGLGTRRNDWGGCSFIYPWAHFAVHNKCNPIQTTLRLSWTLVSAGFIFERLGWPFFSSPSYTTLLSLWGSDGFILSVWWYLPVPCRLNFLSCFFCSKQNADEGVFFIPGAQGEIIHWFVYYLWDRSSMMKSFAFHIRSFHSSILLGSYSPNAERFTFPLGLCWTQKAIWQVVGHWDFLVRWAESGGWCYERLFKSDLPLDVWASKHKFGPLFCVDWPMLIVCFIFCRCKRNEWTTYIWGLVLCWYPRP